MASGTAADPININDSPSPQRTPAPPIPDKSTRPQVAKKNPPSTIVVPAPVSRQQLRSDPPTMTMNKEQHIQQKLETPSAATSKLTFAQVANRGISTPPRPKPKTWVSMPQKSEKTPKKEERTTFHDKNTSTTLAPGLLVIRTVTTDKTHVAAIKELVDAKRESILSLDPEHEIIDESDTHLVVKASNPKLAAKIVGAFNDVAAEYSKRFGKDPKYANFFAATTKIQNTAYVTTATNKTNSAGKTYTGRQLLQALKLNKPLTLKIFVGLPQFIRKGEYTSMLAFNVVEFGNDVNKLDGTRILIHDGVSTIMKRRFKARALFCSKCSRWGHALWTPCHATVISCGICAGLHPTNRHSPLYDKAPTKCLNCNGPHPADSTECPCFINRHDVWELRSILEKAAAERKAATKVSKRPDEDKEKAKDNMEIDTNKDGFDITPADVADGWSKVGPSRKARKGRGPKGDSA